MPPPSSQRSLAQPLWRSLQVGLAVVLVGIVLVVGLTRTQVGRNSVRDRMEAIFNQRYEGTLSIGALQGTLIDEFVATEVQLRDPSGRLVATVDSIHATPQWANLLTAELSVRTLTLFGPHLSLVQDSSGRWNATRALRRRGPRSPSSPSRDLTLANIEVKQGRVTTTRRGAAPAAVQQDWLFDYTETTVTDLSFTASVQRSATQSFFDLRTGSFSLPDSDLQASSLQGRLRRTATGWSLSDLDLSLDTTRIRGRASLLTSSRNGDRNAFTLDLERSRIDHDELRRLVPRLPVADVVTIEGSLRGTRSRLHADGITITHNTSFATLDGTVEETADALTVDVSLTESRLVPRDVREVWPGLPLQHTPETGPLFVDGTLRGTTSPAEPLRQNVNLQATLAARNSHGTVQGSLAVARARAAPLTYNASFDADSLNLAPFLGNPALSSELNGHVEAQGTGMEIDSLESEINVSLAPSQFRGRPLASAEGRVTITGTSAQGTVTLRQKEGGRVYVKGSTTNLKTQPTYTAVLTSSNVDLAPLGEALPATDLNTRLTLRASGRQWRSFTGTAIVNVDSSTIYRADRTIGLPSHSATIHLADRESDRPRIEVSGSVATLTLDGTSLGPPLWTTMSTWGTALRTAVRRERNKPSPSQTLSPIPDISPSVPPPDRAELSAQNRAALTQMTSPGPIEARAELHVHQPEIVNAWWTLFPPQAKDFSAESTLTVGADSLNVSGQLSASHLQSHSHEVKDLQAKYELSGRFDEPLAQSTRIHADVSARRMTLGGVPVLNASTSLSYGGRTGTLELTADSVGIADSLRVAGDLHITPSDNELRLHRLSVGINGNEWANATPASVFAYSNAFVVSPLVLRRPHPKTPSLQQVRLSGTISSNPTDTLSIEADNVYLPPFSQATGMQRLLGGDLSGQIHLRSGWGRPSLVGDISVRRLSYDRRILGDAHLRTDYDAQSPDLAVNGSLNAEVASTDSLTGPELVPNGARTVEPNRLSLSGRVRLPSWLRWESQERSSLPDDEDLDLSVQIERADLFFFRYIFEEQVSQVRGYVRGPLHIGGRFGHPLFDAGLTLENGEVSLPLFGLEYKMSGPVDVDRRGIHPREVYVQDDEGHATITGSILFNDYQFFSFDLSASLDGLTVIDVSETEDLPFYGHIRGSGPLRLTGPLPDATLRSNSARTTPDSELYIPVSGRSVEEDLGFIVFADSTGRAPDVRSPTRRPNILADRPEGVPTFVEGLNIDLNIIAPNESTVHLVFDPIVGDVVTVVGSGRVQLQRQEGDFSVYGNFDATDGTYLFTAGEVFVRRFSINQGTITWDGDPTNAKMDLNAEYRTRASPSGLPGYENFRGRIPVTVQLHITGRVRTPQVDLSLSQTRSNDRNILVGSESLDAILNQPARTTEYATSVLLTNTFLLTTESITRSGRADGSGSSTRLTTAGNQLAFNSVSHLVSSQLNRYLGQALPNVDLNFGFQGEDPNNLDLIYGMALRLLNERLIIRGEGVYTGDDPDARQAQGPQGEFVVEVRLSSRVSAKVFYRRTGDELTRNRALTSSRGAGLSYQTRFSNWWMLFDRLFGWLLPSDTAPDDEAPSSESVAHPSSPSSDSIRKSDRPYPE